ncbi:MAG TPA: DegV family protein [Limnochordia bacterium]|mgnify:CR=1 FL=1|nr:DegV family protein [Limnochordia bacterium]
MTRISADSTCDLSPDLVQSLGISITPLSITVDDEVFKDGVDLTPAELIAHVEAGRHCQTGAVNVYEYQEHFQKLTAQGDEVVHISLGSGFSSCYNNALLAARDFPGVKVVDSRNLSTGSGHLVYEAALLAQGGGTAAEIAAELERLVPKVDASFIIDQLDYLARGGRCSAITAQGAKILRLKPCIEVRDGAMIVGRKYRGNFEKAVRLYVEDRLAQNGGLDPCRAFITHVACSPEVLNMVRSLLEDTGHFQEIIITEAGCTITNHCGPNTLGVLFRRLS